MTPEAPLIPTVIDFTTTIVVAESEAGKKAALRQ